MYIIKDWAGNDLTEYYETFESFEDAWAALQVCFGDLPEKEYSDQMSEFFVDQQGE